MSVKFSRLKRSHKEICLMHYSVYEFVYRRLKRFQVLFSV